jgi:hypothetical protein
MQCRRSKVESNFALSAAKSIDMFMLLRVISNAGSHQDIIKPMISRMV